MIYLQTLGLVIQYSHSASQDWKSICCSVGTDAEFVEGGGGETHRINRGQGGIQAGSCPMICFKPLQIWEADINKSVKIIVVPISCT